MFREADFKDRRLHASYVNKPVPAFQQLCKVDSTTQSRQLSISPRASVPANEDLTVPTTWDTYYDPSNPDADWSGMVSKSHMNRKHCNDHVSQRIGIVSDEHGIVSKEERIEFPRKRRNHHESGASSSSIIGGIDTENRYQTNYRNLTDQDATSRSQLTIMKRELPKKRLEDPAQVKSQRDRSANNTPREDYYSENANSYELSHGTRGHVQAQAANNRVGTVSMTKSLLSNLGASLLDTIPVPEQTNSTRANSKVLVTEIYNPRPGYTGRRPPN